MIYFNRLFLTLTHAESLHQNRVDMVASMGMTRTPRNVVTWWFIPVSKSVIILVTSGIILFSPFITRVITYLVSGMNHQVWLPFFEYPMGKISYTHRIHACYILYMVTWIPSIYPSHVSIFLPAPWIRHGIWVAAG